MIKKSVRNCLSAGTIFTVLAGFVWLSQPTAHADAINWHSDLTSSLKEAKDQNKLILADVYTDWCGWCKRLDKDTFTDPQLDAYLQNYFVCAKLNAEDGGEGQKAAADNGVSGYPSALVFTPDGKLLGRIEGFRDAEGYAQELQKFQAAFRR